MKLLSIYNPEDNKILRSNSKLVTQEDRNSGLVGDVISQMQLFAEKYPNSV
jgi:hypothetical protein